MNDYPETVDLPSYIPGYDSYIEKKNNLEDTDEFTKNDDKMIDEYRLERSEKNGTTDL